MPSFNRFGQWCSGTAGRGTYYGHVNPDNTIVGRHLWSGSGGTKWLVNRILCANYWQDLPQRVVAYNTITGQPTNIVVEAFNTITTSQLGQWAGFNTLFGVKDWQNRVFPQSSIDKDSMGIDGSYCIKRNYQSGGGWDLLFPDDSRIPITEGEMYEITNLGNGKVVWTNAEGTQAFSMNTFPYEPITFPIWKPRMILIGNEYWQLYGCPLGCFFHPVNSTFGYKIGDTGDYFGLDAYVNGNDIQIIWATKEGETLSDIKALNLKLTDERTQLKIQPIPNSGGEMRIRAFERPMWQAPYYSFHKRYGDSDFNDYKHYGNAITVIGDELDDNVRDTELTRLKQLGYPLIVDIGTHEPDRIYDNLTIAWLAAGGNINELVDNVNRGLMYYEKPVIAYLDGDGWPEDNPFVSKNIWPSIQAYRFRGETIEQFINRVTQVINRVSKYKLPMVLVSRFDDFNGDQSIENILECMKYYEFWLSMYPFVGHMPFADRRGNGISKIPQMKDWAIAFNYAIPFGRPNRFDYWRPQGQSNLDVLKNKFGQTRASIVLEKDLREDILRRYL